MLAVKALLVDFDGTACLQDVSELLLDEFGEAGWERFDDAVAAGEMGLREAAEHQVGMLRGSREEMLAFALERAELAPTFAPFVAWARERDLPLVLASDGFAFYIRPILGRAGLGDLEVVTNELVEAEGGGGGGASKTVGVRVLSSEPLVGSDRTLTGGSDRPSPALLLRHPNAHPECIGCGTCKMLAAQRLRDAHGAIAFVGEGQSDRYGALYSDVVFAKDALVQICEQDGVPSLPWDTFDDVREALEGAETLPGPLAPERCPGWRTA
jgi:2-hydroxy-3-keto-5-methylthiopentenyl-1-phosphate phosphatase